jgi:hypothetical protein
VHLQVKSSQFVIKIECGQTDQGGCVYSTSLLGIGRHSAIALSKAGWNLVLTARRLNELKETEALCPNETLILAGDITDEPFVKGVFETAVAHFGESNHNPRLFKNPVIELVGPNNRSTRSSIQCKYNPKKMGSKMLNYFPTLRTPEYPRNKCPSKPFL